MNELEVIQYIDNFENFANDNARNVFGIKELLLTADADLSARRDVMESIDNAAGGMFNGLTDTATRKAFVVNNGLGCLADNAGATAGAADPTYIVDGATVKFCDRYSLTTSPLYKATSDEKTIRAPVNNVDRFKAALSKTAYEGAMPTGYDSAYYSYDSLVAAVAWFPAFCSVEGSVEDCKQQIAAFLAVTQVLTTDGATAFKLKEDACTVTAGTRACLEYPGPETIAAHYMYDVAEYFTGSQFVWGTTSYKARGAGMIKGMETYWRFGQALGAFRDAGNSSNGYLSSAASSYFMESATTQQFTKVTNAMMDNPVLTNVESWAAGLWRFLTPVTHDTLVQFQEKSSPSTDRFTYQMEDSYLTPSASEWLLGRVTSNAGYITTFSDAATSTTGMRGVLKSYFGTGCKTTGQSTEVTSATGAFTTWLTLVGGTARGINSCSNTTEAVFAQNVDFDGPFYFSPNMPSIAETGDIVLIYADAGACLNTYLPTPYRAFETGAYRECVAHNYAVYQAPGI